MNLRRGEAIRVLAIVVAVALYALRLTLGTDAGPLTVGPYTVSAFAVVAAAVVVLALPEVLEYLPGPFRKQRSDGNGDA